MFPKLLLAIILILGYLVKLKEIIKNQRGQKIIEVCGRGEEGRGCIKWAEKWLLQFRHVPIIFFILYPIYSGW